MNYTGKVRWNGDTVNGFKYERQTVDTYTGVTQWVESPPPVKPVAMTGLWLHKNAGENEHISICVEVEGKWFQVFSQPLHFFDDGITSHIFNAPAIVSEFNHVDVPTPGKRSSFDL